jgi:ppGpp synthetase/RelA/SpoT-type nucleotidyltranferase
MAYDIKTSDIQNLELFVARLLDKNYEPSQEIYKLFPTDFQAKIEAAHTMGEYSPSLAADLAAALNEHVVNQSSALALDLFAESALTGGSKSLPGSPAAINRRLLAEAYPASVQVNFSRKNDAVEWFKYYVEKFELVRPSYSAYALMLRERFETVCRELAPLAIVQARPKSIESFAEKILRKPKYVNPLAQLTDLCGVRVIAETDDEIDRIVAFIRGNFKIDEPNSGDTRNRLGFTEFGYCAVHLIVQLPFDAVTNQSLFGLTAEVQVKTMLQHAWSAVGHDRIYKSSFTVPDQIKRDLHRVAAMLEESDNAFGRAVNKLDEYRTHYGAYLSAPKIREEITTQETVLGCIKEVRDQQSVRLKIAGLNKATWNWKAAADVLEPLLGVTNNPVVTGEYGYARCREFAATPSRRGYQEGAAKLTLAKQIAVTRSTSIQKSAICTYVAWAYANKAKHGDTALYSSARDNYREAYELDNTDPFALALYLTFEVLCLRSRDFVKHMRFSIFDAICQCEAHILAGIEIPWAYFAIGRFRLLLGEYTQALGAYCKGIAHFLDNDCELPDIAIQEERDFLQTINLGSPLPRKDRWVDDLLLIALWLRRKDAAAIKEIRSRKKHALHIKPPLVIVAGAADVNVNARIQLYRRYMESALSGFNGTVLSGGTTSGIPGLVAEIARASRGNSPVFSLLGYVPEQLPHDAKIAPEYRLYTTDGSDFSPEQPIQAWIDLIAAGVDPKDVRLLGINGGDVASFEYQAALALGAKVGLFVDSGRAVEEIKDDVTWQKNGSLLLLPHDSMVAWAFVNVQDKIDPVPAAVPESFVSGAAESIHNFFLHENRKNDIDKNYPQYKDWSDLDDSYRESNISQARFMFNILNKFGYEITPAEPDGAQAIVFPQVEAREMARMEHGRYVVERELGGWRYGDPRNNERKLHPLLVAWHALPESEKVKDNQAVEKWPHILKDAGYQLKKKDTVVDRG